MESKEALRVCQSISRDLAPALKKLAEVFASATTANEEIKAANEEKTELARQITENKTEIAGLSEKKKQISKDVELEIADARKRTAKVLLEIKAIHDKTMDEIHTTREKAIEDLKDAKRDLNLANQALESVNAAIAKAKEEGKKMSEIVNA